MAFIYPEGLFTQLEFDKILDDLAKRCLGKQAANEAIKLTPLSSAELILERLEAVSAYLEMKEHGLSLDLVEYHSLDRPFVALQTEGAVVEIDYLLELRNQLRHIQRWFALFDEEKASSFSGVWAILQRTTPLPDTVNRMDQIFDDEGNIRDSASEALRRIRKQIRAQQKSLDQAFNKVLIHFQNLGYLTDHLESIKNGRRVLGVQAEHKRKVPGIILDESSTGRTVFIQPSEAIEIENALFDTRNDEKRETQKILRELCGHLREILPELKSSHQVVIEIDLLKAKSQQANALGAEMAEVVDEPRLEITRARHPLLLLKHRSSPEEVIPFDLRLDSQQQIIVISGPNAGGKTITLKAVGLIALMCQSGLLVPVDAESKLGIYQKFLADIGDQQSIEQDLSTYSSHLQNMRHFIEQGDSNTLFLVDEFGSGTEPAIGGALAESVLIKLCQNGCQGVVTTHYGNLKILAANVLGMINASMDFDRDRLRPTYHLRSDIPGSSFAFEMAKRSGLPTELIELAKKKIGGKEGQLEHLLTSLQKDRVSLDAKLRSVEQKETDLDRLVRNYERLQQELEVKRKKLKLREKTLKLQQKSTSSQELDRVIKELRQKEKLRSAKQLADKLKKEKADLREEVSTIQQEIVKSTSTQAKPIKVGDTVRMKIGGLTGTIDRIYKGKATVLVGNMRLDAHLDELEHSRAQIDLNPTRSVQSHLQGINAHHRLDIRGLRRSQALRRIEQFIDQALVANLKTVEIIHGKGNGTLKQTVSDKLKEYSQTFTAYHPEASQGGDGVTLIELS